MRPAVVGGVRGSLCRGTTGCELVSGALGCLQGLELLALVCLETAQQGLGRGDLGVDLLLGCLGVLARGGRGDLLLSELHLQLGQDEASRGGLAQRGALGTGHLVERGGLLEELLGVVGKERLETRVDATGRVGGAGHRVDGAGHLAVLRLGRSDAHLEGGDTPLDGVLLVHRRIPLLSGIGSIVLEGLDLSLDLRDRGARRSRHGG